MAEIYRRPAWEDVLKGVDDVLLTHEQVAYLRRVIEEDRAYMHRHGIAVDRGSLDKQMEEAKRSGRLRPSQVPSFVDGGGGAGGGGGYSPPRLLPFEAALEEVPLPPLAEVEEACGSMRELTELQSRKRVRGDYLNGLRRRMDEFESRVDWWGTPPEASALEEYAELVRFVRHEMAEVRGLGPDLVRFITQRSAYGSPYTRGITDSAPPPTEGTAGNEVPLRESPGSEAGTFNREEFKRRARHVVAAADAKPDLKSWRELGEEAARREADELRSSDRFASAVEADAIRVCIQEGLKREYGWDRIPREQYGARKQIALLRALQKAEGARN